MVGLHYSLVNRTAQMMGRLTLNPVKHIDPVGTIVCSRNIINGRWFNFWLGKTCTSNPIKTFDDLNLIWRRWR